jgi:hypothetical protein
MKILKGKMTMFLSNLSYTGHLDERWLQVYFIVGLCLLDIEMFSYIF